MSRLDLVNLGIVTDCMISKLGLVNLVLSRLGFVNLVFTDCIISRLSLVNFVITDYYINIGFGKPCIHELFNI